jgi:hypothetical protein
MWQNRRQLELTHCGEQATLHLDLTSILSLLLLYRLWQKEKEVTPAHKNKHIYSPNPAISSTDLHCPRFLLRPIPVVALSPVGRKKARRKRGYRTAHVHLLPTPAICETHLGKAMEPSTFKILVVLCSYNGSIACGKRVNGKKVNQSL